VIRGDGAIEEIAECVEEILTQLQDRRDINGLSGVDSSIADSRESGDLRLSADEARQDGEVASNEACLRQSWPPRPLGRADD
jgi:hypothetical protein